MLRRVETVKRRLVPVDHAVVNQVQARSIAFANGCRTTAVFVSNLLRIGRGEATARVRAAEALGSRRTITGQAVEPRFPLVAAAQAEGVLSERHAAVIVRRVDALPDEIAEQSGDWLEADPGRSTAGTWTRPCWTVTPGNWSTGWIRTVSSTSSVTGTRPAASTCTAAPTAPAASKQTSPPNAPNCWPPNWTRSPNRDPSSEAGPDPRTARQRRHDGFEQLLKLADAGRAAAQSRRHHHHRAAHHGRRRLDHR